MKYEYYDGSVTLTDKMGSDLSVVNAARVSFNKKIEMLKPEDEKLINYLAKHKHMSPFRHVQLTLTLEGIPEFILRQLYKHQVGISYTAGDYKEAATIWNEVSGRYVNFDVDFFSPSKFRKQNPNNKQASLKNDYIEDEDEAKSIYRKAMDMAYRSHSRLLELGVCKEQARLVLPLSFKTSVVWTASLEALAHFVKLRTHEGAQVEIQVLAEIVHKIMSEVAPISTKALLSENIQPSGLAPRPAPVIK